MWLVGYPRPSSFRVRSCNKARVCGQKTAAYLTITSDGGSSSVFWEGAVVVSKRVSTLLALVVDDEPALRHCLRGLL